MQQSSVPSQPQLLVPHLSAPSHSVSFLQLPSPTKHCPWIRLQQLSPFAPMQGFRHFILEPQTLGDLQSSSVEHSEEQIYQSPLSSWFYRILFHNGSKNIFWIDLRKTWKRTWFTLKHLGFTSFSEWCCGIQCPNSFLSFWKKVSIKQTYRMFETSWYFWHPPHLCTRWIHPEILNDGKSILPGGFVW